MLNSSEWGGIIAAVLLMLTLLCMGVDKSLAETAALIVSGPSFLTMLYMLHKSERKRQANRPQALAQASDLWDQCESNAQGRTEPASNP